MEPTCKNKGPYQELCTTAIRQAAIRCIQLSEIVFFLYGSLWGWDWPVGDESGVGQWDKYGLLSFFVLLAGNLAFGHEHSQELGKGNMEAA